MRALGPHLMSRPARGRCNREERRNRDELRLPGRSPSRSFRTPNPKALWLPRFLRSSLFIPSSRRLSACFLVAAAVLLGGTAHGQSASFTARTGRNPVGLGEAFPFEVTLSLEGGRMEDYRAPDFRGFRVVSEYPSDSTQIQMGGGGASMRRIHTRRYQLVALQKGKLTIGPATARVDGRELRTEKVTVTVVDPGQAPAPSLFPGFADDLEPEAAPPPDPTHPAGQRNFLRVLPSKTRAFVGEQITIEWSLCLAERQNNYSPTKEPRTDGFWVEELEVPQTQQGLSLTEQVIDGRAYLVAPLMRKALFGLKPGKYTVTPLEADVARTGFFGHPLRSEHLTAAPVSLEILPLPPGAPAGFDPAAVGRFTLTAEVDRDQVKVGDAITLKLRLQGHGNVRKSPLPALPRLDGWKVYDPKVTTHLDRGDEIGGSKTAEYLLLPERPGTTEIPALVFAYFDPRKAAYLTARTEPLHLVVSGEPLAQAPGAATPTPAPAGSENLLAIDVRPLRNRPTLRRNLGAALYRTPWFLSVVIAPPALLGLLSLVAVARARLGRESESKRRRRLQRLAGRRLRSATALLHEGRLAPSLAEIERVLRELLASKLGATAAGMSRDELRAALVTSGASPTLVDGTVAALDDCDRARFAPGSITAEEASAAIERATELIEGFEKLGTRPGGSS
jgi:hypothetical protein